MSVLLPKAFCLLRARAGREKEKEEEAQEEEESRGKGCRRNSTTQILTERGVDEAAVAHGLLLSHSKTKIPSLAAKASQLETTMLGEISQFQKDKYHTLSLMQRQPSCKRQDH